jgi:hypothetical protein
MKVIKTALICLFASITIQIPAKAQSSPEFCQIHAGNVSRYVSEYNLFEHYARTPYRSFLTNASVYKVDKQLIAKPLYYMTAPDGNVVAAFQFKGKYGDHVIGDKEVVVQLIKYYSLSSAFEIAGFCINGVFAPAPKVVTYSTADLPFNTLSALQEASISVSGEQVYRMFK